jgi:predicted phage terminase large subunit-like protein
MSDLMASTDYDTLLVFAPPGSAKSHHVSVAFPSWWMANNQTKSVITASHSAELAAKWGRRVRNLLWQHANTLGVAMSTDSQAADRWALEKGGEYLAAGVGTGIAGFRADLGIIDDPFGSKEDAYSERIREKVWDWYINDFSARLKPEAKRVIMHTRWHMDDLAGRIVEHAEVTGERIKVLKLPAIAGSDDPLGRKPGEYLWDDPGGYNYGAFLRKRKTETAALEWAALYQQEPVPESGGFFKREWFKYYDQLPAGVRKYGASDYATKADAGDFTVHGVCAVDADGNIYVDDIWRAQTTTDVWVDVMLDMATGHEVFQWGEEQGQIIKSLGPFIDRRMKERNIHFHRQQFTSVADKPSRARSIQGRMSQGKVLFRRHAVWRLAFEAELLSFDAGKHDDQVDMLSLFGRMLDKMYPPKKAPLPIPVRRSTVRGAGMLG